MGPSGCGKSTLLHLCGAMDRPTRGRLTFEGRELGAARRRRADAAAPRPHRVRVPVLQPAADADPRRQHRPALPAGRACRRPRPRRGPRNWRRGSGLRTASPTTRSRSRAARRNGQRSRAPWSTGRPWSSPTSRPATSTRPTAPRVLALLAELNRDLGVTILLATHAAEVARGRGPHRAHARRTHRRGRMRRRLFRQFIVRRLVGDASRTPTTVAGIALGIAVVIAIQLTNASSVRGFETALDTVSGHASVEIAAPGGVDETLLPSLGWLREFGEVSPVIEGEMALVTDAMSRRVAAAPHRSRQGAGRGHPARSARSATTRSPPRGTATTGADRGIAVADRGAALTSQQFLAIADQPAERGHHREAGAAPRLRARRRDPADGRRSRRTPTSSARCSKTRARRGSWTAASC